MDLWTLPQHRLACSIFALKNWWFRVQTENAFQQNCTKVSRFFWTFKRSSMLTHRRCPVLVNVIQAFSRAGWGSGGLQQWRILQYLSCPLNLEPWNSRENGTNKGTKTMGRRISSVDVLTLKLKLQDHESRVSYFWKNFKHIESLYTLYSSSSGVGCCPQGCWQYSPPSASACAWAQRSDFQSWTVPKVWKNDETWLPLTMDIYGCLWISMDIYGYLWISMDILWISCGYLWTMTTGMRMGGPSSSSALGPSFQAVFVTSGKARPWKT